MNAKRDRWKGRGWGRGGGGGGRGEGEKDGYNGGARRRSSAVNNDGKQSTRKHVGTRRNTISHCVMGG